MKNKNKTIALLPKVIGGFAFVCVFMLNIIFFVQKDNSFSNLSLAALSAYAQTGDADGGELPPAIVDCTGNNCRKLEAEFADGTGACWWRCKFSGYTTDSCSPWMEWLMQYCSVVST